MNHANIRTGNHSIGPRHIGGVLAASAVALLLTAAGAAKGQDDPLSGPKVVDRAPPGERAFGEQGQERGPGKMARRAAPHAMFLRAVNSLEGDLQVSEAQRDQIMAIEQEFRAQMRAFREEHKDELAALRKQARLTRAEEGPGPDGTPPREGRPGRGSARPGDTKDLPPEVAEARKKLRALMESAPKHDSFQARQWAVLNADQQAAVKDVMEDMRERIESGEQRRRPGVPALRERGRAPEDAGRRPRRGPGTPPPPADRDDEPGMPPPEQD